MSIIPILGPAQDITDTPDAKNITKGAEAIKIEFNSKLLKSIDMKCMRQVASNSEKLNKLTFRTSVNMCTPAPPAAKNVDKVRAA